MALTSELARRAAALELGAISGPDRERVRHCLLDWLGATMAGAQAPVARMAQAVALADGGAPSAAILGTAHRVGPRDAAFANGIAAHALELDDTAHWMTGHPGAPICSATLALAEARALPGGAVLVALAAGYDTACRIALALGPGHGAAGWHATGTVGTVGAAVACARLLGLDSAGTERALGLAATQAAGLKMSIGTMGKPLHAGRAAANGQAAAALAEQGFTAPADAVERFAEAHTATFDALRPRREMGDQLGIRSVVFRRHACCGLALPVIAGIEGLRREHRFSSDDVLRVDLGVTEHVRAICASTRPATGLEGKFSLPFVAAVALAGAGDGLGVFTDEGVRDPRLTALRDRVDVHVHDRADAATVVELELADGTRLRACRHPARPAGDDQLPEQWQGLLDRFRAIAVPLVGEDRCDDVATRVRDLAGSEPVGRLLAGAQLER